MPFRVLLVILSFALLTPVQATIKQGGVCQRALHIGTPRPPRIESESESGDDGMPLTSLRFEIGPMPDAFDTRPRIVPLSFAGMLPSEFLNDYNLTLQFGYETGLPSNNESLEFHSDKKWLGGYLHKMEISVRQRILSITAWKMYRTSTEHSWNEGEHELNVKVDLNVLPQLGFHTVDGTPKTFLYYPGEVWLNYHKGGVKKELVMGARIACIGHFERFGELGR
jgi:hypothetical protein